MKLNIECHVYHHFADPQTEICRNIEEKLQIMSNAIDNLRAAVSSVDANVDAGFSAIADALAELASDIANLPNADDIDAEAARLSQMAEDIATGTSMVAQAIRDAIPTEIES